MTASQGHINVRPRARRCGSRPGRDADWINEATDAAVVRLLEAGAHFELINHSEAEHGFDITDDSPESVSIPKFAP